MSVDAAGNQSAVAGPITCLTPDTQAPASLALAYSSKTATSVAFTTVTASDNVGVASMYIGGFANGAAAPADYATFTAGAGGAITSNLAAGQTSVSTTGTVSNLSAGTAYSFYLCALDAAGNYAVTATAVNVTVVAPLPPLYYSATHVYSVNSGSLPPMGNPPSRNATLGTLVRTNTFSISMWIWHYTVGSANVIWHIGLSGNGAPMVFLALQGYGTSFGANPQIRMDNGQLPEDVLAGPTRTWINLIMTCNARSVMLYITPTGGQTRYNTTSIIFDFTAPRDLYSNPATFNFGTMLSNDPQSEARSKLNGYIENVQAFSTVLTAAERALITNAGVGQSSIDYVAAIDAYFPQA